MTVLTAAIFAGAMALPAFAQVGAGVAGNANVGDSGTHTGVNSDTANSDAEHAEPSSPTDSSPTVMRRHMQHSEASTKPGLNNGRDVGASTGVGTSVGSSGARFGLNANVPKDSTPTGGY